ncbi:hypothetical protein [Citreimonas sp.]|uniref:hypothetical protein n=1 Tax=Citreimonas sp. TaxID=3036715 RepID=UPI0035C8472F
MTDGTDKTPAPAEDRPREAQAQPPHVEDLRGRTTTRHDRSAHRSHAWLYEDLLN